MTIDIKVPSIVLLNHGDEGSLTRTPVSSEEIEDAKYWSERALVYRMGIEYTDTQESYLYFYFFYLISIQETMNFFININIKQHPAQPPSRILIFIVDY